MGEGARIMEHRKRERRGTVAKTKLGQLWEELLDKLAVWPDKVKK